MRRPVPGPALLVRRRLLTLILLTLGLLCAAVAVRSTGAADPLVFVEDAGPLVRWSAPLVRVVQDLAAAVTVGALAVHLLVVRAPVLARAAGLAALAWAVTGLLGVVLTFADASGMGLGAAGFVDALLRDVWAFEVTRIGLVSAVGAAVVSLVALPARRLGTRSAAMLGALAVLSLAVLGLTSHTGTSSDHETSVNAMAVHVVAAAGWAGGLAALVIVRRAALPDPLTAVRRWSALALWSFGAVAASGAVAATTRLGAWSDLTTPYGRLVAVKIAALLALGVTGWVHRRSTIERMRLVPSGREFWRLVLGELAVMAATFGVAAALARSAPPVPEDVLDPSPALALTGFPAPAPPSLWSWVLTWRADWLLLGLGAVAIATYAAGLVRLRRVDRTWRAPRTAAWVGGWVLHTVATSGGAGVHGRVALSWHVAVTLVELLVVPLLLALGDPVGLARRGSRPRGDGTLGVHEVAGAAAALPGRIGGPLLWSGISALALVLLVLGPGLDWTLRTHPGHVIAALGLPALGFLLATSVLTAARAGRRRTARGAVLAVAVTVAVLGSVLLLGSRPLAADFFGSLGLPWLTDLVGEQRRAGTVVWAVGGLAAAVLGAAARRPRQGRRSTLMARRSSIAR